MPKKYAQYEDLKFEAQYGFGGAWRAHMNFKNGWGVSVRQLGRERLDSSTEFSVALLHKGHLAVLCPDGVYQQLTREGVTRVMKAVQDLPTKKTLAQVK